MQATILILFALFARVSSFESIYVGFYSEGSCSNAYRYETRFIGQCVPDSNGHLLIQSNNGTFELQVHSSTDRTCCGKPITTSEVKKGDCNGMEEGYFKILPSYFGGDRENYAQLRFFFDPNCQQLAKVFIVSPYSCEDPENIDTNCRSAQDGLYSMQTRCGGSGPYSEFSNSGSQIDCLTLAPTLTPTSSPTFDQTSTPTVTTDSVCSKVTCLNGGTCSQGSCICSDRWLPPFCGIECNDVKRGMSCDTTGAITEVSDSTITVDEKNPSPSYRFRPLVPIELQIVVLVAFTFSTSALTVPAAAVFLTLANGGAVVMNQLSLPPIYVTMDHKRGDARLDIQATVSFLGNGTFNCSAVVGNQEQFSIIVARYHNGSIYSGPLSFTPSSSILPQKASSLPANITTGLTSSSHTSVPNIIVGLLLLFISIR